MIDACSLRRHTHEITHAGTPDRRRDTNGCGLVEVERRERIVLEGCEGGSILTAALFTLFAVIAHPSQ